MQISYKDYIAKKQELYGEAAASGEVREDVTWDMLRSQINSGLQLGLSQEQIDMYTTAFYSYEQMEVIKFALYADLEADILVKLCDPKLETKDMIHIMLHSEETKCLTGAVNSIATYMDELQMVRQEHETVEQDLQNRLREEQEKNHLLEQKLEELNKKKKEPESRRDQPERRKRFGKKKTQHLSAEALPDDFNLSNYIIQAHLSADQMEVIRFAIEKQIDDQMLVQLIDQHLPAEQLRNMVAVILTKKLWSRRIRTMESRQIVQYIKKDSIDLSEIDQRLSAMHYKLSMYALLNESSSIDDNICDLAELRDLNKEVKRIVQMLSIRCNSIDRILSDTSEQIAKNNRK